MKKKLIQVFGWYGVVAILLAYALVSFEVILPTHPAYQILNITGSLGLFCEAWSRRDKQPAVLNIVWILVGIIAILTHL
jgi:hypothetical protein